MSDFLRLPEGSPAAELMASLVHAGDMLAEHGHLMQPATAAPHLFRLLCLGAGLLLATHATSAATAATTLERAARR